METLHFCGAHAFLIQRSESEALQFWKSCMHRAVRAFSQCRIEDAKTYFSAAMEIALLRFSQTGNEQFSASQLVKPLEFICEIDLAEEQIEQASAMLEFIAKIIEVKSILCSENDRETLERMRKTVREFSLSETDCGDHLTFHSQPKGYSRPTGLTKLTRHDTFH